MPDENDAADKSKLESAAEIAKDLLRQEDVHRVNIRESADEVEISVGRYSLSAAFAILWSAVKKLFGGFGK